jgi:transposase-like protein
MSNLDHSKLQALAKELAKSVKTQEDLSDLSSMLVKMTVEAALGAEMEVHLGYSKNQLSDSDNSRNGFSTKTLKGNHGELELMIPRDRESSGACQDSCHSLLII